MVRASTKRATKAKAMKTTKGKTVKSKAKATKSKAKATKSKATKSKAKATKSVNSVKSNLGPRRQSYFHSEEFVYTSHPTKGEPYGKITTVNMNDKKGEKTMLMLNKTGKPIKSSLKKSVLTRPPGLVEAFVF